jgi:hypothetical protein
MRKELRQLAPGRERNRVGYLLWLYLIPGGLLVLALAKMIARGDWLIVLAVLAIGALPLLLAFLCTWAERKLRARRSKRRGGPVSEDD